MRRRWGPFALLSCALAATAASRALAEDGSASSGTTGGNASKGSPGTSSSEVPAPAGDGASIAERAYNRSISAYAAGDKVTALAEMKEAHRTSAHPELLYNIAKLERELGHCEASLAAYRNYLQHGHGGEFHDAAVSAERELGKACGAPPRSPQAPGYWTATRVVGWSAIAASAVSASFAIYFAASADSADADVQRMVQARVKEGNAWTTQDQERETDASSARTAAIVSTALAASFATGGVLLLVLPGRTERPPPSVSLVPQQGGAFVGYAQRF